MKIQDAHTHFFSRPFFETLARLSPREEEPAAILADVTARTGVELPDGDVDAHADRWLAEMDAAGVERMVTFASLPPEVPAVAQAAARSGGRLLPYTLVDPTSAEAKDFAAEVLGARGFRGLLTFPAMHHFSPGDRRCDPIWELARAHGAPVLVHCGILQVKLRDLVGLPRPYDPSFANPLAVVPAANRFPDVTFVLPHFGGGLFREALMTGAQCENVCVDTSSSNDWMRTEPSGLDLTRVFARSLDVFGAERILFGTDSSTFPRGYRAEVREAQLGALEGAGADARQIEAVMGGNLARLLPDLQPA